MVRCEVWMHGYMRDGRYGCVTMRDGSCLSFTSEL